MRILEKTQYDLSGHRDENSLYKFRQRNKVALTKNIIYELGMESDKFPLLTMTEGQGGLSIKEAKALNDTSYTWPIMGRDRHTTEVIGLVGSETKPGLLFSEFDVIFKDERALPMYGMYLPDKSGMVRVQKAHGAYGGGFRYTLQLQGGNPDLFVASTNFAKGMHWVLAAPTTPESKGLGTRSHTMAPGEMTNQYGFYRFGMEISGNITNTVIEMEFDIEGGGKTKKWMPWDMWLFEKNKMLYLEEDMWDQEYNRKEDGTFTLYDKDSNEPIVRGAGVTQQIKEGGIYDTYSGNLTLDKFDAISDEIFRDDSDNGKMEIVLLTGTGGRRAFHRAIMQDAVNKGYTQALGDNMISGGKYLQYGKYFTQYHTINGHVISVMTANIFDKGLKAEMDEKNGNFMPGTTLPVSSFDMYFLDASVYNGERNIQAVTMKGQELITGIYKGMTEVPEMWGNAVGDTISTEKDISSYHMKLARGINLLKARNSVYLKAEA